MVARGGNACVVEEVEEYGNGCKGKVQVQWKGWRNVGMVAKRENACVAEGVEECVHGCKEGKCLCGGRGGGIWAWLQGGKCMCGGRGGGM